MNDDFPMPFSPVTLVFPRITSSALALAQSESIRTIFINCDIGRLFGLNPKAVQPISRSAVAKNKHQFDSMVLALCNNDM